MILKKSNRGFYFRAGCFSVRVARGEYGLWARICINPSTQRWIKLFGFNQKIIEFGR